MPRAFHALTSTKLPQGIVARLKYAYNTIVHPDIPVDAPAQKKWEASVEGPMLTVSVVFLILFTGAALGKTNSQGTIIAEYGMSLTWVIFIIDYVVRLILAKPRGRWFWTHLPELVIVALPWFRPLRVLRIVPILFLMQRFSAKNQRVTVAIYTGAGSALMIVVAALSMYDAEYGMPGSQIHSFSDALWWAVVTVTTVGYGDIYPVTNFGRGVGVFLMLGGIAAAGVVTATVAAWLVQQVENDPEKDELEVDLLAEVTALRQEVHQLRHDLASAGRRQPQDTGPQSMTADPTAQGVSAAIIDSALASDGSSHPSPAVRGPGAVD